MMQLKFLIVSFSAILIVTSCSQKENKNVVPVEKSTQTINTLQSLTKRDSVLQELNEAIQANPDSFRLRDAFIDRLSYLGANSIAIQFIDTTLAYMPKNAADLLYKQGILYLELQDTAKAIQSLLKATKHTATPQPLLMLGSLYGYTANNNALLVANDLEKNNFNKEAFYIRGLYYAATNNCKQAIKYYDSAIIASYSFMNAYIEKAICEIKQNNSPEAISTLNRAIVLNNRFEEAYYYMAVAYKNLKNYDEARSYAATALKLDTTYLEAQQLLQSLPK